MHFLTKGFALLLSLSAHVALAFAATTGVLRQPLPSDAPPPALLDLAELEVIAQEPVLSPAISRDTPAPPHHHHPYPIAADHDAIAHDPSLQHTFAESRTRSPSPANSALSPASPDATSANSDAAVPSERLASTAPRFLINMGTASSAPGSAAPSSSARDDAPLAEAAVDERATLLVGNSPSYTAEAEAAGVEANLPLEIVIDASGAVVSARALAHVGYGLDEAALRAVRSYRFSPARRAAKPHSVRMRWVVRFQLR